MLLTFRFNDHHQNEAKLKGQPATIDEVLPEPQVISCACNDETKGEENSHISTRAHPKPRGSQTG